MSYKPTIQQNVSNVLKETNFSGLGEKKVGKVRDSYFQDDKIILVSTDRHSSFDRIIAHVPYKGQVLTQMSNFWFEKTKDIVKNHVIATPDPCVVVGKKCKVLPVEVIVRGFITGSTSTALWTNYQKGQRDFGSFVLPEGMKKNQRLDKPVITPTTKFEEHDRPLLPKQVVEEGFVEETLWERVQDVALRLFKRGQEVAIEHGLILVDTKYEFGIDETGELLLIDEIHTCDSSRYWKAGSYEERLAQEFEPENFDKEFLRLWFRDNCDPYKDETLLEAPEELIVELSSRYIEIYEQLTGEKFIFPEGVVSQRIENNIKSYLGTSSVSIQKEESLPVTKNACLCKKEGIVPIIMGSESDMDFVAKITKKLDELGVPHIEYVASAHKNPELVLKIVREYNEGDKKACFITVAGRSNGLSGVTAAAAVHPVIACPPFSDKSDYLVNIHSSLQMPSNTPVLTVVDPGNAALAAARILK